MSYLVPCSRKVAGKFASSALCWCGWPLRGSPWAWGSGLLWHTWLLSALPLGHSRDHKYIWLENLLIWANSACKQRGKDKRGESHKEHLLLTTRDHISYLVKPCNVDEVITTTSRYSAMCAQYVWMHKTMPNPFPLMRLEHITSQPRGWGVGFNSTLAAHERPVGSIWWWRLICRPTVYSPRWGQCVAQIQLGNSSGRTAGRMNCRRATSSCQHLHSSLHPTTILQRPACLTVETIHGTIINQGSGTTASVCTLIFTCLSDSFSPFLPSSLPPSWSTGLPWSGNMPQRVSLNGGSSLPVSVGS